MTGAAVISDFSFPRLQCSPRRRGSRGNKIHCFPRGQSLSAQKQTDPFGQGQDIKRKETEKQQTV